MSNDENACIRYLMKEMDPSEEVLMERSMMEDEDLLIEVESLRQTLKRLDDLPELDPPSAVTRTLIQKARERRLQAHSPYTVFASHMRYVSAAAAILLFVAFGGIWMIDFDAGQQPDEQPVNQVRSSAMQGGTELNVMPVNSTSSPWIDRNDVIYFQDQFNSQADFDSMLNTSTRKLKELSDPLLDSRDARGLQLTGANK